MKKAVYLSIAALVMTVVASHPYWVGGEIEAQFRAQTTALQQQLVVQPGITLTLDHYQRGYLGSIAETTFVLAPQAVMNTTADSPSLPLYFQQPLTVTLRHRISHGPWIDGVFNRNIAAKIVTTLVIDNPGRQSVLRFYFPAQPAFEAVTQIEWEGRVTSRGGMPVYAGRDHSGQYDLEWGGFHFEINGDWLALHSEGSFKGPRFELSNELLGVTLGNFEGNYNSQLSPQGFSLGKGELSVGLVKMRGVAGVKGRDQQVSISDLKFLYDAQQQGVLIDVKQQAGFRLLHVNNVSYTKGVIRVELNNLDAVALQSLQQHHESLLHTQAERGTVDSTQVQRFLIQGLQKVLPDLLRQSPELHISRAEVVTADGLVSAQLRIAVDSDASALSFVEMQTNPTVLLPYLQVEIDLKLPATIIEQQARTVVREKIVAQLQESEQTMTPQELSQQTRRAAEQMLNQFEIQNILRRQQGHYTAELFYDDGRIFLNGVPADNLLNMLPPLKSS